MNKKVLVTGFKCAGRSMICARAALLAPFLVKVCCTLMNRSSAHVSLKVPHNIDTLVLTALVAPWRFSGPAQVPPSCLEGRTTSIMVVEGVLRVGYTRLLTSNSATTFFVPATFAESEENRPVFVYPSAYVHHCASSLVWKEKCCRIGE